MAIITLLVKSYEGKYLKNVDAYLKTLLRGLEVKVEVSGVTSRGWVQILLSGEDEKTAKEYLANEVGLCPMQGNFVKKFSLMKGYVSSIDKIKGEIAQIKKK